MNYRLQDRNCIRVYGESCHGCKSTKTDFMLSFGAGKIDELDGNNGKTGETDRIIDIFTNRKQAEMLYDELKKRLGK